MRVGAGDGTEVGWDVGADVGNGDVGIGDGRAVGRRDTVGAAVG